MRTHCVIASVAWQSRSRIDQRCRQISPSTAGFQYPRGPATNHPLSRWERAGVRVKLLTPTVHPTLPAQRPPGEGRQTEAQPVQRLSIVPQCHCEEHSDVAISMALNTRRRNAVATTTRLPRFARNDKMGTRGGQHPRTVDIRLAQAGTGCEQSASRGILGYKPTISRQAGPAGVDHGIRASGVPRFDRLAG